MEFADIIYMRGLSHMRGLAAFDDVRQPWELIVRIVRVLSRLEQGIRC